MSSMRTVEHRIRAEVILPVPSDGEPGLHLSQPGLARIVAEIPPHSVPALASSALNVAHMALLEPGLHAESVVRAISRPAPVSTADAFPLDDFTVLRLSVGEAVFDFRLSAEQKRNLVRLLR